MGVTGNQLYPSEQVFKYPKAGEKNAKVSLHMYNATSATTKRIALGNYEYIPCLLYTSPSPRDQRGSRMPSSA